MSDKDDISQKTLAVHGGEPRTYPYDALAAPITQTATYSFADTAELIAYFEGRKEREEYGRYGNPSVRLVEEKVAALEGTEDAVAFASGMAAVTSSILALVKSGSHVILFADCYRRTRQFVTMFLSRFGVSHTLIPPADVERFADALEEAGIENDLHIYDDVQHGFWLWVDRDPDVAAEPALDAWNRLKAYLKRVAG